MFSLDFPGFACMTFGTLENDRSPKASNLIKIKLVLNSLCCVAPPPPPPVSILQSKVLLPFIKTSYSCVGGGGGGENGPQWGGAVFSDQFLLLPGAKLL